MSVFVFASLGFVAAQTAQPFDNVLTEASNWLKAWEFTLDDTVLVLHFKAPTQALADFTIEQLTGKLSSSPTTAQIVEKRNRPVSLSSVNSKVAKELSDTEAASFGQSVGATIVLTGAFSPSGANWKLNLTAVSVAKKNVVWSDAYIIKPNAAFLKLATPAAAPAPTVQTSAAPAPVPVVSTPVSAPITAPAPAKKDSDAFSVTKDDLNTSVNQVQTFKRFGAWLEKNFPNITISEIQNEKSYDKSKPHKLTFSWSHTDKIDVVTTMATFYKLLAELSKDSAYIEAIKEDNKGNMPSGKFSFYPTTYANKDESAAYKIFNSVRKLSYSGSTDYYPSLYWDIEFSLMDQAGNVIDTYKDTLSRKPPYGKGTAEGSKSFIISEGAYQNMAGVTLTKTAMKHHY
ncbi:MAG: hypothetical protein LBT01_08670 [Spirochaetaceae bacterium]|nr:hypothetical protein [Spirochaetaceae bacterium]